MAYSSNGPDQHRGDLYLRNQPQVGNDITTITGRTFVPASSIPADTLQIIFIGQSTNSNSVSGTMPVISNPDKIFNLSIANKGCSFKAAYPLISSDLILGHHGIILADLLINTGLASRVLLTHIVCGGNYFADWALTGGTVGGSFAGVRTGELAYRIALTGRCLYNQGLLGLKTIIDHQGGEWDSDPVVTPQANSAAAINSIIAQFTEAQLLKTGNVFFEHLNTRITNTLADRTVTRSAENSVVNGGLVRLGADIDTLGDAYRYDGTHFSAAGASAQASLKFPIYQNFLLNG